MPFDLKLSWGVNVYGENRSGDQLGLRKGKAKASIDLSSEEMKLLEIFTSKEPGGYQHPKSLADKRDNRSEHSSEVPEKIEESEKLKNRNENKHPANNKQDNQTVEPQLNKPPHKILVLMRNQEIRPVDMQRHLLRAIVRHKPTLEQKITGGLNLRRRITDKLFPQFGITKK